jgi:hypothetical protein
MSCPGVGEDDAHCDGCIESARLRAVLAHTPENVAAVIASIEHPEAGPRDVVWDGARILAVLRARAGLAVTDDDTLTRDEKVACYLLDRADQYVTSSASWVSLTDAVESILMGDHHQAAREGFDDDLVARVRKIYRAAKAARDGSP